MAYSTIFSAPKYSRIHYITTPTSSPFMNWYKNNKNKQIILAHDEHHGPDICEHSSFFPDPDGNAGYFCYFYDGDYTFFNIYARVLIDVEKKGLYFSDIIVDYECIFWDEEKKFHGKHKSFKKLEDAQYILSQFTHSFFGRDWRVHSRFTKLHKKNIEKATMKRLKKLTGFTDLPDDIQNKIHIASLPWPRDIQTNVPDHIVKNAKDVWSSFVGSTSDNGWGKYYAWNSVIGVFPEINGDIFLFKGL